MDREDLADLVHDVIIEQVANLLGVDPDELPLTRAERGPVGQPLRPRATGRAAAAPPRLPAQATRRLSLRRSRSESPPQMPNRSS